MNSQSTTRFATLPKPCRFLHTMPRVPRAVSPTPYPRYPAQGCSALCEVTRLRSAGHGLLTGSTESGTRLKLELELSGTENRGSRTCRESS